MNEEEIKAKEAAEAEAARLAAEAEAASSSTEEIDYKVIAEANEALAKAEAARADAAEALIVKNKAIEKRQVNPTLTEERVLELIKTATKEEASPEALALEEATKNLAIAKAKTAEIARSLKAKEGTRSDSANTHFDGEKGTAPKLQDNSPLKEFKYEGNGIYSQKLKSGKTMYKNQNAGPGQPKTWVE